MRYLSVCSGIEAATVAWHDLGWEAAAYSEIEKFPSEVLKYHYPSVPNVGDMTKYKEWEIGANRLDLLVGGTPCQSFSVAGLRKGLEDPRGNLALVYCGILDKFKPKWFIWENVCGVLSSSNGRDFGSFLGAVAELRYGFAYRVLDAQHFGVPQQRRRVFVIGHLGDCVPAGKVLFESKCLSGDIKKKQEAKSKNVANSGETINDSVWKGVHLKDLGNIVKTLTASYGTGGADYQVKPLVAQKNRIRKLTPVECERLLGFPDNYTNIKENCPDTKRYKALGNSMAVPVMKWIGKRIQMVEDGLI